MKHWSRAALATAILLISSLAFAGTPLAGTWKFNKDKSKLAGVTLTFEETSDGSIRYTRAGLAYEFKPDGQATLTPDGHTAAWTRVDDANWAAVIKLSSNIVSNQTYHVGDDGKSLLFTSTGTKPDGTSFSNSTTYERMLGSKGLLGKWKSTKVDSSITGYEIVDESDGSITWSLPDYKATVHLKADGKDYPATGPTIPSGVTITLIKTGARSFTMTEKKDGKPIFRAREAVSSDGKTLTEIGGAVSVHEPATVIYDKQ